MPGWSITAEPRACDVTELAARLRRAGCVFAEDEARILTDAAICDGVLDADLLETLVRRRELGEPPEHIVGYVEFAGLRLSVGPGVFIPRQRSVFLASSTLDAVRDAGERPVVVEAYCGVAPIAAVIAAGVDARAPELIVVDHSPAALTHARRNLPAPARVERAALPGEMDVVLRRAGVLGSVDVMAAVAPYVPGTQRDLLPAEATDHEPADSHDGGPDGLDAVRGLIDGARRWCSVSGVMLLECHRDQAAAALPHAGDRGLDCRVRPSDDGQTAVLEVRAPQ